MQQTFGAMVAASLLAGLASGCATVTSGKEQTLSIDTDPSGANCTMVQGGVDVATFKTPHAVTVHRAGKPLIVACTKAGYQQTRVVIDTTMSDGAWGNLVVGGLIGIMVDQSTGAAYRYYDPPKFSLIAAGDVPPESSLVIAKGVTLLPPAIKPMAAARAVETAPPEPPIVAAPARPAGTLPAAGIWECGLRSGTRYYKLQFVVAPNRSMVITSYDNAPATIVTKDPLTLTALNPRGTRTMNIVWNNDNTMVIIGPNTNKPDTTFRNDGACTKV